MYHLDDYSKYIDYIRLDLMPLLTIFQLYRQLYWWRKWSTRKEKNTDLSHLFIQYTGTMNSTKVVI